MLGWLGNLEKEVVLDPLDPVDKQDQVDQLVKLVQEVNLELRVH